MSRKKEKVVGFRAEGDIVARIDEIAKSLDRETRADVLEAIVKSFFKYNVPPEDIEKARKLVIMKRHNRLNELEKYMNRSEMVEIVIDKDIAKEINAEVREGKSLNLNRSEVVEATIKIVFENRRDKKQFSEFLRKVILEKRKRDVSNAR